MNWINRWTVACWICLLVAGAGAGCGESIEPIGPGSLTVSWELRPGGCRAAGVETVAVGLKNKSSDNADPIKKTAACESGSLVFEGLSAANYKLWLFGRDGEGLVTYSAGPDEVTVYAERANRAPVLQLVARSSQLAVKWRFRDGRVCGAHDIRRVAVDVYDQKGYRLAHATAACTDGETTLADVPPGVHRVEVTGPAGESTRAVGKTSATFRPAETTDLEVVLEREDE